MSQFTRYSKLSWMLLLALLLAALAPAALAATAPVTVTVLDHAGAGLPGVQIVGYWSGSWHSCAALTDVNGQATCDFDTGYTKIRAVFNGTSAEQDLADLALSNYTFQTAQVTVELRDGSGALILAPNDSSGGKVAMVYGAIYNKGYTGTDGKLPLEVFAGSQPTFRVDYNLGFLQRNDVVVQPGTATAPIVFQTAAVTLFHSGLININKGALYPFTKPTMQMFPGTYNFRFSGIAFIDILVPETGVSKLVNLMRLYDHTGAPLAGGAVRGGFGTNFGTFFASGPTVGNVTFDIRNATSQPGQMSYEMGFNGTTAVKTQDVSVASVFDFQTIQMTVRMETCDGTPVDGGNARFGSGSTFTTRWFQGGPTGSSAPGEAVAEFFPGTYSFEMQYAATQQAKLNVVVPNANTTLTWNTTAFEVAWPGPISYGGSTGDARFFTNPTELLPGPVMFHLRDYVNSENVLVTGYRTQLIVGTCDQMTFRLLNGGNRPELGRYTKYVRYLNEFEALAQSSPMVFADEFGLVPPDGLLLEISAVGGAPEHFGGRQRVGVRAPGESGGWTDTVSGAEVLILKVGPDPSVAGRNWHSIMARVDGDNNAVVQADYYENGAWVGQTTHSVPDIRQVAFGMGMPFDEIRLSATAGRFGLKGFNVAAFSFAQ